MNNKLKLASLISYSLIILMGHIIGIPFFVWLIYHSINFGSIDQFYAICGITGLLLNFTNYIEFKWVRLMSFVLMLIPIASRLYHVPLYKFNYLSFHIPLAIFVVAYIVFILRN